MVIYYIKEGLEVVDNTPEAEDRLESMNYLEEKAERDRKRERKNRARKAPIYTYVKG